MQVGWCCCAERPTVGQWGSRQIGRCRLLPGFAGLAGQGRLRNRCQQDPQQEQELWNESTRPEVSGGIGHAAVEGGAHMAAAPVSGRESPVLRRCPSTRCTATQGTGASRLPSSLSASCRAHPRRRRWAAGGKGPPGGGASTMSSVCWAWRCKRPRPLWRQNCASLRLGKTNWSLRPLGCMDLPPCKPLLSAACRLASHSRGRTASCVWNMRPAL